MVFRAWQISHVLFASESSVVAFDSSGCQPSWLLLQARSDKIDLHSSCASNDPLTLSLTIPGALDKILVAAEPLFSSDPSSPKPPNSDSESDSEERITPATDEVFGDCKSKGCLLEWAMHHADGDAAIHFVPPRVKAQSPFQTAQDLENWNWYQFPPERIHEDYHDLDNEYWGLQKVFDDLVISRYTNFNEEKGPNAVVSIVHEDPTDDEDVDDQMYVVDGEEGKEYRCTGMNRKGPMQAGQERVPRLTRDDMPKLHQFSDVGWITWKTFAGHNGDNIRGLRYFISVAITNPQTRSVCRKVFLDKNLVLTGWPGEAFLSGTDEFHAILGTPNMRGYGYMLIQHKADLGNMYVNAVRVFKCEGKGSLCILAYAYQEAPAEPVDVPMDQSMVTSGEISRRDEGSNVMRLHMIFAKL
ncbi:hypothetical protein BKA58DRAFT_401903 [Alternaria rosae]|uniref:uncharacterized protein n=1 Tax=Alternaria rosae TaxID=1187941 RepID=UPI001E8E085F|nr:uncharacterized protein BKA58DRAFT_401903 [Alternaria rosae]KAH6870362.1 hypothetical protein BKA58DRAFT_401903 [Alternaria rosae]